MTFWGYNDIACRAVGFHKNIPILEKGLQANQHPLLQGMVYTQCNEVGLELQWHCESLCRTDADVVEHPDQLATMKNWCFTVVPGAKLELEGTGGRTQDGLEGR